MMADEYIRRDDFIQYLEKCKKGAAVTNLVWAAIMAIERDVRDMPAADVAPVDMIWYMNAEELLTVASKRLCRKADPATQEIVKKMRTLVLDHCPEFRGLMAPPCAFMDECPEMEPCNEGQA